MTTCLLWLIPMSACVADVTRDAFENEFFEPVVVSSLGMGADRLVQLSAEQPEELLRAKIVLSEFFKSLENISGDPLKFMTQDYIHEKPDRLSVRQSLVADETVILQIALSGFGYANDGNTIELRFYATVLSEGMFEVGEGQAIIQKSGSSWRIEKVFISP